MSFSARTMFSWGFETEDVISLSVLQSGFVFFLRHPEEKRSAAISRITRSVLLRRFCFFKENFKSFPVLFTDEVVDFKSSF